jgi:TRAP-type C4-dicarboxylate transport system substrate-binding protein
MAKNAEELRMRRKTVFVIFISILLILGSGSLFAQRGSTSQSGSLEVKLASPLPRESPWGRTLDRIASEWSRVTNGQVRLSIRHGGIEGNESKMLLSLASDTIQAGIFTPFGLSSIDKSIMTLSAPFLIRNDRELDAVMQELQSELDTRFNRGNYFMLAWSKSGFVNIFSRDPVVTPTDLQRMRIASNSEAAEMNTAFKTMGFQIIESDWTDVGNKLNAGTVAAAYQNPAAVAAYQLHTMLKNMMSTNIAPVLGGIVINQLTWRKIGDLNPRYQQELLRVTRSIATEFDASLQKTVSDAVQTMTRAGLKVNTPTAAQEQLWYNEIDKVTPGLLGTTYDRDLYNRINTIVTRVRGR